MMADSGEIYSVSLEIEIHILYCRESRDKLNQLINKAYDRISG
jgi:hypothetical protein